MTPPSLILTFNYPSHPYLHSLLSPLSRTSHTSFSSLSLFSLSPLNYSSEVKKDWSWLFEKINCPVAKNPGMSLVSKLATFLNKLVEPGQIGQIGLTGPTCPTWPPRPRPKSRSTTISEINFDHQGFGRRQKVESVLSEMGLSNILKNCGE